MAVLRLSARRLLVWAAGFAALSALILLAIPAVFGVPQPKIHIQWRDAVEINRRTLEQQWRLTEPTRLNADTWSYVPTDVSTERLRAIVMHPSVADTNGINRRAFRISDTPPLTPRRGGLLQAGPWASRGARLLAYVLAGVAVLLIGWTAVTVPLIPGSTARAVPRALLARAGAAGRAAAIRLTRVSVVVAAGVLFVVAVAWRYLTFTGFTNDHYIHLALAQQMILGHRPVRDFVDVGWPLMYLLSGGMWRLAGDALFSEWVIAAAGFGIGAAYTVAAGFRLSGSLLVAALVTVLEIVAYPRTYSYPKVAMYAVGSWMMLALAADPSRRRIVAAAAIVAVAFLFRHDHGVYIGLASAACLALSGRAEGWGTVARRIATLGSAAIIFLLPWILFVTLNGGLLAYFALGLEYARDEADATTLASLPAIGGSGTATAEAWLFWLFWLLPVVAAGVAWRRRVTGTERWNGESSAVLALALLAVFVNAGFLREPLRFRLPDAIVPAGLLGAWALGLIYSERWRRPAAQHAVRAVTAVVLILAAAAIGQVSDLAGQVENTDLMRGPVRASERAVDVARLLRTRHRDNALPPSRFSTALMPFFAYLDRCTSPAERLIITGEAPEVLVIGGRGFAGEGVVYGSWYASAARQDRTLGQLQMAPPLFVLHIGDYKGFRERFPLIDAYLGTAYAPMAEIAVPETNSIRILVEKGRTSARTDLETGWPCFL